MQRFLLLVILVSFVLTSTAFKSSENSIHGIVKDEKTNPLVHATVMLLKSSDSSLVKGEVTNSQGEFTFSQIENGSYLISVTNIGFQKYYSNVLIVDAAHPSAQLSFQLLPSDKSVKELKVVAKKPMLEVKADKTVFNVEQSINAAGNNALDLLRKSPGVRVDKDDHIEMRGKNNVLVYIDGKPTYLSSQDLASMLKNMQANDIESIELITNPSSKYDASGNAGIINIKLKKNKKFGTNGSVNAGASYGKYFKENAGLNLNYRNKKVNVFGSLTHTIGQNYNNQQLDRTQNGVWYDFKSDNVNKNNSNGIRAGIDYYHNSKSIFGIMLNAMNTDGDFTSSSRTLIGASGMPYDKILVASNRIDAGRYNVSGNVNYKYEDTLGRSVAIDLDYAEFHSAGKSYQPNTYWNPEETNVISQSIFKNNTPTIIHIYSAKLDYERNLWKGKLGLGLKSAYVKTDNDFKFYDVVNSIDTLNLDRTNHFLYTENVNAAYANYARNINSKLSMQLGLRLEQTLSNGMLSSSRSQSDDTVKRSYLDYFPSAGLSYNANANHSFGLTYSRRIDRPSYQDLNPFENKLDELTYQKGNAFLRPQYTNSIEVSHSFKQAVTTTISYSHTKDIYMQTTDTTEGTRTYVTQKNFASQDIAGINISFPVPLKKWWMIYANVNSNYVMLDANFEGRKLSNRYVTYSFYADNTIKLPKEFSLNISGWFSGPDYWGGTFKMKPMGSLDLGVQRTFLNKKLTAKLSVGDIFRTQRWFATSNFSGLYIKGNGYAESRQVRLNLTYRFGSNQIAKQRDHKSGASSESRRIK